MSKVSADCLFSLDYDSNNCHASLYLETPQIDIGINCFTLESFIHEINEIEVCTLLNELGRKLRDRTINEWSFIKGHIVSHLLSPFGEHCLIYPVTRKNYKKGEWLIPKGDKHDKR